MITKFYSSEKIIKLFILFLFVFNSLNTIIAQPPPCAKPPDPPGFNYQAVIRDNNGNIIKNKNISLIIKISHSLCASDTLYSESFLATTNDFGIINLAIGKGNTISGDFLNIDWSAIGYPYDISIFVDTDAGSNYKYFGTSRLMLVPFAMYSLKSGISSSIPVMSNEERGFLVPIAGMQIVNSDTKCLNYYNGTNWQEICGTCVPQPTTANAGTDQLNVNAVATLAANNPKYGTGQWTIISGTGGNINKADNPLSTFSGTAGASYTLRWTITNSCSSSSDDVIISFCTPPSASNAGPDQLNIAGTSATLAANAPSVGTGLWSIISGAGGTITTPSSRTSTFTGTPGVSYTLRWTISTPSCGSSSDDVVISFQSDPFYVPLISVAGGTFSMGQTNANIGGHFSGDEQPVHSVTLSSFNIAKYEVTQKLWKNVMGTNPSNYAGCDSCPVENVSWDNAKTFITNLNQKTGLTYRLPTEAEWEFAARGGNLSKGYLYSGSNTIDSVGWYWSNGAIKTHGVGLLKANELGIFDMCGNVSEWCSDGYSGDYYSMSPASNPPGYTSSTTKVIRGGNFEGLWYDCRSCNRDYGLPVQGWRNTGFRLAK